MSFILDALRKSEHARQSLGNAALAELPLGRRSRSQPWWIVAIAALLLVNLAILVILLLRDNSPKAVASPQPVAQPTRAAPSTAPIVLSSAAPAQSSAVRSLADEASPPQVQYESVPRSETPLASPPDGPALVRRIDDRPLAAGSVVTEAPSGLPDMRIDMHVYAKAPADRFVFINMRKYVEGQTLAEGPILYEITPDGVRLVYKGQQLRLQRP